MIRCILLKLDEVVGPDVDMSDIFSVSMSRSHTYISYESS